MKRLTCLLVALAVGLTAVSALAKDPPKEEVITVAVFNFESTDDGIRDLGPKVAALINAHLSADPTLITVERAELEKLLGEQEMGMSGTIKPETAAKIGQLTGAKVVVTGRVFKVDREMVMVAKIIGTETGRVYGEIVKGGTNASATDMAGDLAKKIAATTIDKVSTLVAKIESADDRIDKIKKEMKTDKLPLLEVRISEQHFGGPTVDPAAQTEIAFIAEKCGFTLVDEKTAKKAEVEIVGEGFSEFGMRKGNLFSCKARVEVKVRDVANGKVLAVDRQTSVAVDLSEQMAAKTALQQAAAELAERLLPKLGQK